MSAIAETPIDFTTEETTEETTTEETTTEEPKTEVKTNVKTETNEETSAEGFQDFAKRSGMILSIKAEITTCKELHENADTLWNLWVDSYNQNGLLPQFLVDLGKKWGVSAELEEVLKKEAAFMARLYHQDMILSIKDELNGLENGSADELWDLCLKKYTNHGLPRFLVNLGKKWGVSKELEEVVRKEADAFSRE